MKIAYILLVVPCLTLLCRAFSPNSSSSHVKSSLQLFPERTHRISVAKVNYYSTNLDPQVGTLSESNCHDEINNDAYEYIPPVVSSSEVDENQTKEDMLKRRKAAMAALLLKRGHSPSLDFDNGGRDQVTQKRQTSIGDRRVGSATRIGNVSRNSSLGGNILKQVLQNKIRETSTNGAHVDFSLHSNTSPNNLHRSVIDTTVQTMIHSNFPASVQPGRTLLRETMPNSSNRYLGQNFLTVRVAFPEDDLDIAHLRLSVFSDFTPDQVRQYRVRACEVLNSRRLKGACCLVASTESSFATSDQTIAGSLEISTHEFDGTDLGRMRPKGSIFYITEVAVSPSLRKSGIGTTLMKGLDKMAAIQNIETIYLHVDVTNMAAIRLYQRAGYEILDSNNTIFREFTTKLNLHDGATKGRVHYLLHKKISETQTWIEPNTVNVTAKGILGFQV